MDKEFLTWVTAELEKRGWSYSELARQTGEFSPSAIARVINEERGVTYPFCMGIAHAFNMRPEPVLRRAGLLPALPGLDNDAAIDRTMEVMRQLTPAERAEVLEYALWRYEREQAEQKRASKMDSAPDASTA
jgi:transcriptional regulator with XRE-family HTH domain